MLNPRSSFICCFCLWGKRKMTNEQLDGRVEREENFIRWNRIPCPSFYFLKLRSVFFFFFLFIEKKKAFHEKTRSIFCLLLPFSDPCCSLQMGGGWTLKVFLLILYNKKKGWARIGYILLLFNGTFHRRHFIFKNWNWIPFPSSILFPSWWKKTKNKRRTR